MENKRNSQAHRIKVFAVVSYSSKDAAFFCRRENKRLSRARRKNFFICATRPERKPVLLLKTKSKNKSEKESNHRIKKTYTHTHTHKHVFTSLPETSKFMLAMRKRLMASKSWLDTLSVVFFASHKKESASVRN